MNSYWAEHHAKQHVEQMRREASGGQLLRRARIDTASEAGHTPPPRAGRIPELRTGLRRRLGPLTALTLSLRGSRRG